MTMSDVHDGAARARLHGADRIRSYGSVEDEYAAATTGVAVFDRGGDGVLTIAGRAAEKMLSGVVTGVMPPPASVDAGPAGTTSGRGELHTVLTPKGKMISDLVLLRLPDDDSGERYQALVPAGGLDGLKAHFARFLPPRFAKVTDVGPETARICVVGPGAAALLSRTLFGLRVEASELEALQPREWFDFDVGGDTVRVVRSDELDVPCWELLLPLAAAPAAWSRLVESGAVPAGGAAWDVLRIEAETALYGIDTDDATIPTEAGLDRTAIDHTKGCYTGQEVIVRIRDRGHVNRRLRRVLLGDLPTPPAGTELFVEGRDKPAGEVRSAAWSPRFGQTVALAWIRRGVWDDDAPQPEFRTG